MRRLCPRNRVEICFTNSGKQNWVPWLLIFPSHASGVSGATMNLLSSSTNYSFCITVDHGHSNFGLLNMKLASANIGVGSELAGFL